jgi:aminoglycoside phosphotransferase family enzyme
MKLTRLIDALSRPEAYPEPVSTVEVRQTHISVVFLTDTQAYKVKKPVDLGFLDFRSPERRRHFCAEEVRLNRRLAPTVYQGVVPITQTGSLLRVDGQGKVIDWAVKMVRLPDACCLQTLVRQGTIDVSTIEALARRVAQLHAEAPVNDGLADFACFEAVAANFRDNFRHASACTVSRAVLDRLTDLAEAELRRQRTRIDGRAARGVPRDTHGDLRPEHVYLLPDPLPGDLAVIDCIEFNERFRYADPVCDMAFLVMELIAQGRRDLADAFATAYFRESGDAEGWALLPLYTAYRATVRAKAEGIKRSDPNLRRADRAAALVRARAYWLLAMAELEEPRRRKPPRRFFPPGPVFPASAPNVSYR